jgi:hypothetical protein
MPEPGHFGPSGPTVKWLGKFGGEFGGMELANLTPKLGAYFGAESGVLVVKAPDSDAFKLEDGDVIQTIDGRKPEGGAHALRILRSYQSGEKVTFAVLRQRKSVSLQVTMPETTDHFIHMEPGMQMPAIPLPPPVGLKQGLEQALEHALEHDDADWEVALPQGTAEGTAR